MNRFQKLAYKAGKYTSKNTHLNANKLGRNYYSLFKNKKEWTYDKCIDFVNWIGEKEHE